MQPKVYKHIFCALTGFLQYFKNLKKGVVCRPVTSVGGDGKTTPGLMFFQYFKNVISAQKMLTYLGYS